MTTEEELINVKDKLHNTKMVLTILEERIKFIDHALSNFVFIYEWEVKNNNGNPFIDKKIEVDFTSISTIYSSYFYQKDLYETWKRKLSLYEYGNEKFERNAKEYLGEKSVVNVMIESWDKVKDLQADLSWQEEAQIKTDYVLKQVNEFLKEKHGDAQEEKK